MLSSSLYTMLKLSKTTYPQKLFPSEFITMNPPILTFVTAGINEDLDPPARNIGDKNLVPACTNRLVTGNVQDFSNLRQ